MSDATPPNAKAGVRFDPVVNLGQVGTSLIVLGSMLAGYVQLTARVDQNSDAIKRVESQAGRETGRIETQLMTRINDERARLDQTQVRTADDIREMKTIVRDGFRDLDAKLDRKADKPAR